MKSKFLVIIGVVFVSILIMLNHHVEYFEVESAYGFCEQYLFSDSKTCTIIWQKPDCPGGGCIFQ